MAALIVIMGVSGCGKTTVGTALAAALERPFFDGDAFHSAANIAKMRSGVPLTDADRKPWVLAMVQATNQQSGGAILACSALTAQVRAWLTAHSRLPIQWVWLDGAQHIIAARLAQREGHFMPAGLLASQFAALEPPQEALRISIDLPLPEQIHRIRSALSAQTAQPAG
jgi:gluconokinase